MDKNMRIKIMKELENNPGISPSAVAAECGVSLRAVYYYRSVFRRASIKKPLALRYKDAVDFMNEDLHCSVTEASNRFCICKKTILDAIENGEILQRVEPVRRNPKNNPPGICYGGPSEKTQQIIGYTKDHPEMSLAQIGEIFGVSRQYVSQCRKKYDDGSARERSDSIRKERND